MMLRASTNHDDPRKTPELKMTGEQLANFYADLCTNYPLITIEDPFDQETRRLLFESESNKLASIGVARGYPEKI